MDKDKVRCLGKQKKKEKNVKWRKGEENTCFQRIRSQSVKFSTTRELDVTDWVSNIQFCHWRGVEAKAIDDSIRSDPP